MVSDPDAHRFNDRTGFEPKSERLRRHRQERAREPVERAPVGYDHARDRDDDWFRDRTRDGIPSRGATREDGEILLATMREFLGSVTARQPREGPEPFASVAHALTVLVEHRIDTAPVKSLSDPQRMERMTGRLGTTYAAPGPDKAIRQAEHVLDVERVWRGAYSGPWDGGVMGEDHCRVCLLLSTVGGLSYRRIALDLGERWGLTYQTDAGEVVSQLGHRMVARVVRHGRRHMRQGLRERGLIPPAEGSEVDVEAYDLIGLGSIAAHISEVMPVSPDTVKRWLEGTDPPPVAQFRRGGTTRYMARSDELSDWLRARVRVS